MEGDDWDASVPPNSLRHPQHHDHESDDNCSTDSQKLRYRRSFDVDGTDRTVPSQFGHVTHASRRPAAVVRANSAGSAVVTSAGGDGLAEIGFHPGQQTRHRSPISTHKINTKNNVTTPSTRRSQPTKHAHKKGRNVGFNMRFGNLIRLFVVLGGLGYLLLMMVLFSNPGLSGPLDLNPGMSQHNRHTFSSRETTDQKKVEARRRAEKEAMKRAQRRQIQTRPPRRNDRDLARGTSRYEFLLADDERRRTSTPDRRKKTTPARVQDLCGTHARNASLAHPDSFLASDALSSKSRVMITGILNPVGFRLALALKERCGVSVITGIDPMYPNTVKNRLDLLQRIQILATSIPKMIQPIVQPLLGLNPRMNKKRPSNGKQPFLLDSTGEVNLLSFHPTHIVHLASFMPEEYQDETATEEGRINVNSPYIANDRFPPMYQMRSSMVSMEHILASIAGEGNARSRPHFTYASSMGVPGVDGHSYDELHSRVKLVDEVLADTYHSLKGVSSVGLRFPRSVYGPWGRPGAPEYELAEAAVDDWNHSTSRHAPRNDLMKLASLVDVAQEDRDFVFVDDVVDAIIAAMQYRPEGSSPTLFNVGAGSVAPLGTAAEIMESMKPTAAKSLAVDTGSSLSFPQTMDYLKWSPSTTLPNGLTKLLAWHLDKKNPFGGPIAVSGGSDNTEESKTAYETGDAFLERNNVDTCAADDTWCNSGSIVLPCISECASKSHCAPSVLDQIFDLTKEVTEGCDIIMYTQSLGYDVPDLYLESQYMEDGERIVCNFAFIPRDSKLVQTVTKKVPNAQLEKFGIPVEEHRVDWMERKLKGLNGRLLYKGWILLWLDDGMKPLSPMDQYMLKMSPSKFFAPSVTHAMFVAENFPVTPNIQDVLFVVDEMRRPHLKQRSVYRNEEDGKKHKYVLDEEPERRAALLTSPLKRMKMSNQLEQRDRVTVMDATKYMSFEIGDDPTQHQPTSLRRQREFYERVPTFVNRMDMKSPFEPFFKYGMTSWIRTRWVVHDLKAEEGRQLRCHWYREHVRWGNDLDQLSFAYVMHKLELERRIAIKAPDDRAKPAYEEHPELKELTDTHEWHAVLGNIDEQEKNEEGGDKSHAADKEVAWYVRIMSERFMLQARKAWVQRQKNKKKKKHR